MFREYKTLVETSRMLRNVHKGIELYGPDCASGEEIAGLELALSRELSQWERAACLYVQGRTQGSEEPMELCVKVLQGELVRGTPNSAGYDLSSAIDVTIPVGQQALIPVGLITQMSAGMFAEIKDRSGMALKRRLTTRAGVIDADYDREWGVILVNESDKPQDIKKGDRIAQAIFQTYLDVGGVILEGARKGGFGSTGGGA